MISTARDKLGGIKADLRSERPKVNTEPTEAQIEAGNYSKGHVRYRGLEVTIENPKGSLRSGVDKDGNAWSSRMRKADYGYIRRAGLAADGDHPDVFIADNPEGDLAYVINQVDPGTGDFDEHKTVLGAVSKDEARKVYLANYPRGWKGLGSIYALTIPQFKWWVREGDLTKPLAAGTLVKAASLPVRHTATREGQMYDIGQLIELLRGRPTTTWSDFPTISRSSREGFSPRRYQAADPAWPVIIDEEGRLWDGRHRVAKARDTGLRQLPAWVASQRDLDQARMSPEKVADVSIRLSRTTIIMPARHDPAEPVEPAKQHKRQPSVAVDLDGTLSEEHDDFDPDVIGAPRENAKKWLDKFRDAGARIIIHTCRGNDDVVRAWLEEHDLPYDHINSNPDQPPGTSSKLYADVTWDNRAVSAKGPLDESGQDVLDRLKTVKSAGLQGLWQFIRANEPSRPFWQQGLRQQLLRPQLTPGLGFWGNLAQNAGQAVDRTRQLAAQQEAAAGLQAALTPGYGLRRALEYLRQGDSLRDPWDRLLIRGHL